MPDSRLLGGSGVIFIKYTSEPTLTEHLALSDKILTIRRYFILERTYFNEKDFYEQFWDHSKSKFSPTASVGFKL